MKSPNPETSLALVLYDAWRAINPDSDLRHGHNTATLTAARVVSIAAAYRRLNEAGCNAELTQRQEKRKDSLSKRADALLAPYGLELANPWGLCEYAVPIGHDGGSETGCVFLA